MTSSLRRLEHALAHPAGAHRLLKALLVALLLLLLAGLCTVAHGGWEYSGYLAEVFDLHTFESADAPEGMASSSDGFGGLLVAAYDAPGSPAQIRVSRLGPDGTELWGQGGVIVPRIIGSLGQQAPVAITHDGAGGAWVAYLVRWSTYELFELSHFTPIGGFARTIAVDTPGTVGDYDHLSVKLLPLAGGDVFVAWTQRSPTTRLHAARFTTAGTRTWDRDVNQDYGHHDQVVTNTWTTWNLAGDYADGALITWLRLEVGTPQIGVQRLLPDGTPFWGTDGHLLWSGYGLDFHSPAVAPDGAGGAFVAMSHRGIVTAQHVGSGGNELWATGGVDVQNSGTPYWALSTDPVLCSDGEFGFFLVHGNDDIHAQRVNWWGGTDWGAGLALGARAGAQSKPDLASDGAGGVVVVWEDLYYAYPGHEWRMLVGARLDATGNTLWGPADLFDTWGLSDPHAVNVVAGPGGGALCTYACYDLDEFADDVWALGLGPNGVSGVETTPELPSGTMLTAAPNPFQTSARLVVQLTGAEAARVTIHDAQGRLVRALAEALPAPGRHTLLWDGRDDRGRVVAGGSYFVRVKAGPARWTTRLVRVR